MPAKGEQQALWRAPHPNKDPNSFNGRQIANRTEEKMTPKMKDRRAKFINALLNGATKQEAAIAAGVPKRSASQQAYIMWAEPYVQQEFKRLLAAIEEDQLVSRKDIILGLRRESEREGPGSSHAARVAAFGRLATIIGADAPAKVEHNVTHRGGIMVVPVMPGGIADWEKQAVETQRVLQHDSATD